MNSCSLNNVNIQDCPSTSQSGPYIPENYHSSRIQSGPLIPNDKKNESKPRKDTSPAVFSDGRTPIPMSASRSKAHPPHIPTGTAEVLTFYPTMEEFRDFKGYIRKMERAHGHLRCGIAKVVPPEGWHPRPTKKNNYSDIDDYEINNPVKESIEGRSGIFYKTNRVYRKKMVVKEFRKLANSATYKNPKPELEGAELESEYFKNILLREPIYGADTEGSVYEDGVEEFNMNKLNTILDETKPSSVISGVNTVYLYFGMYKTTFPWHSEDMDLYSINYLHFGAPKYWFAISSESAERFERLMQQQFAGQDVSCKAFLRHKSFIVTPSLLRAYNIPFGTMTQRPNEFIITFPKGYHMGFNTGYNLAESTNFATDRWIDYGKNAILCKCVKDTVEIDMRPFMKKYRPDEYDQWYNYWYGDRGLCKTDLKGKKVKKTAAASKRKIEISNDHSSKRARLGADGGMRSGSISDDSAGSIWSSSSSPSDEGTKQIFAATMIALKYDLSTAVANRCDTEELKRKFKKNTKDLLSVCTNLFAERQQNEIDGRYWPHCEVCACFQPSHIRPRCSVIPKASQRLIGSIQFSKKGIKGEGPEEEKEVSRLLTCDNCHVTVHSACYSGDDPKDGEKWLCLRCRNHTDVQIRSISCSLCELRGGALIPCRLGSDETFAHVTCAILNRRTMFDRSSGPNSCNTSPPPKQDTYSSLIPRLPEDYLMEFGETYENSRWECHVCRKSKEGLLTCLLCVEETNSSALPTTAHLTCGRQVGFLFETRQFPKVAVMICDKHMDSHLVDKSLSGFVNIKCGDEVFALLDGESWEKGCVEAISGKPVAVVDFLDGSVSRDLHSSDIVSCECVTCDQFEHQYGARVKVKWDDGVIYDGYFRGIGSQPEYKIRFPNGCFNNFSRSKLLSKREMTSKKKSEY